jgi:hypothetical protein
MMDRMRTPRSAVRLLLASALLVGGLLAAAGPAAADLPVFIENDAAGANGAIGIIGESSTQGTLPWIGDDLAALGWGPIRGYAAPGVRIPPDLAGFAIPVVQRWRAEGFDPRVWIIGLGANDVGFSTTSGPKAVAYIDSMLDAIGPSREVLWVNITHHEADWQAAWNAALAQVATRRFNLHVFDWASIAAQHPEWIYSDQVHLTPTGYRQKARMVAEATRPLMQANPVPATFAATAAAGPEAGLAPVDPVRVLDTRLSGGAIAAGGTRIVDLSSTVPAGATAAAVNLTVDQPGADGYLTAWDCAGAPPGVSSLNYAAAQPRGAATVVALSASRTFCVFSLAATALVVDVNGAYTPTTGERFTPQAPARILDTRTTGAPGPGGIAKVTVPKVNGAVPSAVTVNLTATGGAQPGFLTAFPCGTATPTVSNVNHGVGAPAANLVTVKVAADGSLCVYTLQRVDVVVDLLGLWGGDGLWYQAAKPTRLLDTRSGTGGWLGAAASLQALDLDAGAVPGVPASAAAIAGTITATGTWGDGFVTTWPCSTPRPTASTLNYGRLQNVPNAAVVALGADRKICAASFVSTYLLFDLTGWFTA